MIYNIGDVVKPRMDLIAQTHTMSYVDHVRWLIDLYPLPWVIKRMAEGTHPSNYYVLDFKSMEVLILPEYEIELVPDLQEKLE